MELSRTLNGARLDTRRTFSQGLSTDLDLAWNKAA